MRRATALIALVLAGPVSAITVPPALMPPTPPPLTTLPPAAQPMQTVTGLRTGITPAVLIGQGVSTVTLWGGLGGLALTGAIAWRRRTPAVA